MVGYSDGKMDANTVKDKAPVKTEILNQCQRVFPDWASRPVDAFDMDDPKGFSSFTMGIRCREPADPPAVLYRRLEGKDNAILDFETEKQVFLLLGDHEIAARCLHYDDTCRIETFYQGRTLTPDDLFEPDILRRIANELYRFHQLTPAGLPAGSFFDMLHAQWGEMARCILVDRIDVFPANEQAMCEELREIYSPATLAKVRRCLPDSELTFCHNDTYHGNIMKLDTGEIRLLDFEFSCLNHKTYDFSNLFAETVMKHQQPDCPYFRIAEPEFGDREFALLINAYLDNATFETSAAREEEFERLLKETWQTLVLSDFKYAMAALPLSVEPIQKIRFIPYAHQRFQKFLKAYEARFGER